MNSKFFEVRKGFTVTYLEGEWVGMGEAYGRWLREKLSKTPLAYFLYEDEKVISHALQGYPKWSRLLGKWTLRLFLLYPTALGTFKEERNFLKGVAKGAGIPARRLWLTYSSPDSLNFLASFLTRISGIAIPHVPMACSSFVVWGSCSTNGVLYHGRNLDFSGGSMWSNNQLIMALKPQVGIPTITITGAGVYTPGVTTTNAEGITMTLHLNFTRDINWLGRNILTLASRISREARSLQDVEKTLASYKRISGWTFAVSDAQRKEAAIFELSGNRMRRIDADNSLVYTNCYLSPELQETEYAPSYTWVENNCSRYSRLKALIAERKGKIDEMQGAMILGDRLDLAAGRDQALGNGISAVANVSSVIFAPGKDRISVAWGEVPPNGAGRYLSLSLSQLFKGEEPNVMEEFEGNPLAPYQKDSLDHYLNALQAWDESMDLAGALEHLNKAIEKDFRGEEPLYRLVRGLLLTKIGKYREALVDLQFVKDSFLSPFRRAQSSLWIARCHDLMGERGKALTLYRELISCSRWKDLTDMAWMGIKKQYSRPMLNRMDITFLLADFIDY